MARVTLENVSVQFPVYGAQASSLRHSLAAAATGGRIGRETGKIVIEALHDISLDLRDGDRLGVVGHNGAGKTTLLRTLAGVYPPARGRYSRTGTVSSLIDPMLGIEMDATGYENITIRGLLLGLSRREIARLTPEVAEFSGLGDYLAMPVRTYSTGMLMRLGFSIATTVRADILLMDEWLSVGDADFKPLAEARLREIVSRTGILVLASHSRELIDRECNAVLELAHGRVVSLTSQRGAAASPVTRPAEAGASTPAVVSRLAEPVAETPAPEPVPRSVDHGAHPSEPAGRLGWTTAAAAHLGLAAALLAGVLSGRRTFVTPGDSADQSLCWLEKVFAAIRRGELVLWDFSTLGGISFVGELQTSPLYPVAWVFGLLGGPSAPRTMDLFLAAHFLLAAAGMHLLARRLGLSQVAAFLAAAIFAYGSSFSLRVNGQPNLFASCAWMPWIVLTLREAVVAAELPRRLAWALAGGGCVALSLLAGHAHAVVLSLLAAAVFAVAAALDLPAGGPRFRRLAAAGGVAGGVAIGLALPQLLATREYLRLAYKWYGPGRTEYPHVVPYTIFEQGSLRLSDLATAVTAQEVSALDGGTLYFTLTGLCLAAVALALGWLSRPGSSILRAATVLGGVALAFAFPAIWPLGPICYGVPLLNLVRAPARGLFLFALAAAVIAGVGLDSLRQFGARLWPGDRRRGLDGAAFVSLIVLVALVSELHGWLPAWVGRPRDQTNTALETVLHDPAVEKLVQLEGSVPTHRYFATRENIPPNVGHLRPLLSVHGYRSSQPKTFCDYFDFNPHSERADALGIRWWVTREPVEGLRLVATVDGRLIHERPAAPPVFWQPGPDGSRRDPGLEQVDWRSNEVRVRFREPIAGRLVFGQTEFPGFRALADGVPVPLVIHEGLMAVDLPAPTREVRFSYAPSWFPWSAAVALATLVAAVVAAAILIAFPPGSRPTA
jgi:lipopolysaccharide transport system ATP-binding protein